MICRGFRKLQRERHSRQQQGKQCVEGMASGLLQREYAMFPRTLSRETKNAVLGGLGLIP